MRISGDTLLAALPAFTNKSVLIESVQDVPDIISEVVNAHKHFAKDYDQIWKFFNNGSLEKICRDLFDFCKENIAYIVEDEHEQTTKSPSAILAMGYGDCKHYAGFIGGVLSAISRNTGRDINWKYRFASYDDFNNDPGHVLIVVSDKGREYWIDPVLNDFDERLQPSFVVDKKIFDMPLYRISGVGQPAPSFDAEFNNALKEVGVIPPELLEAAADQVDSIANTVFDAVEKLFADQVANYPVKKQSTFDKIIQNVMTWVGTAAPMGVFRIRPATVSQAAEMLKKGYPNLDLQLAVPASERGEIWHTATMVLQETLLSLENLIAFATKSDIIPVTQPGLPGLTSAGSSNSLLISAIAGVATYFFTKKVSMAGLVGVGTYLITGGLKTQTPVYTPAYPTAPVQQPSAGSDGGGGGFDFGGIWDSIKNIFGGSGSSDADEPEVSNEEVFI